MKGEERRTTAEISSSHPTLTTTPGTGALCSLHLVVMVLYSSLPFTTTLPLLESFGFRVSIKTPNDVGSAGGISVDVIVRASSLSVRGSVELGDAVAMLICSRMGR